tara:strand:- start:388 stop:567 length:180 start_codon:yes stop_codon:yes gene_type:complete
MKMDIDKAITEHREEFDEMMRKHRELIAQQDRDIIALRNQVDKLIAGLSTCELDMKAGK